MISLYTRDGDFWDTVADIRNRWDIQVQAEVPPTLGPHQLHFPPTAPKYAPITEEGGEEWSRFAKRWHREMVDLYNLVIPEECRLSSIPDISESLWTLFLSACVVYDPPGDKLEEFVGSHEFGLVGYRDPEDPFRDVPENFMYSPPIRYMRDAEDVERAWKKALYGFANGIIQKHEKSPDRDISEIVIETLHSVIDEGPVKEDHDRNRARPFIEVRSWHTQEDIDSAFRMISDAKQERPQQGRRKRDPLRAVQCAVLRDHYGWKYERIAEKYGWDPGSNSVSKYIADGRRILKGT